MSAIGNRATTLPSTRETAVSQASRGWHLFPCGTPTGSSHGHAPGQGGAVNCQRCDTEKAPRHGWKWKERNSSDPTVIRAHWPADGPNIGVTCWSSRLVVVDLDNVSHGGELPEEWRLPGVAEGADVLAVLAERNGQGWPATYTAQTASGGLHLYFRAVEGRPIPNSAGKVGPMIDVRGNINRDGTPGGGYVLGAGSVVGGARYEVLVEADPIPLPEWLADLADPPRRETPRQPVAIAPISGGVPGGYGFAALSGELDRVLAAANGTRNDTLCRAAFSLGQLVGGGVLARDTVEMGLRNAAARIGLYADEPQKTDRTIRSGIDSGARNPRGGVA